MREDEITRLKIGNFVLDASFCRRNILKGGVMILSKGRFKGRQVVLPKNLNSHLLEEKQFEFCASFYATENNYKFIIVGLYRSPSSCTETFLDRLSVLIDYLYKKCDVIIWAGDININVLVNEKEQKMLNNLMVSHNMKYLVDFPTRIDGDTKTSIDNFLIKHSSVKVESVTGVVTLLSDHDGQLLEIGTSLSNPNTNNFILEEKRNFSEENLALFCRLLEKESWIDVYFAAVENKYEVFLSIFKFYFEQVFPKKFIKKVKKKQVWITKELKEEKKY